MSEAFAKRWEHTIGSDELRNQALICFIVTTFDNNENILCTEVHFFCNHCFDRWNPELSLRQFSGKKKAQWNYSEYFDGEKDEKFFSVRSTWYVISGGPWLFQKL